MKVTPRTSTSALMPSAHESDASSVRSRTRRLGDGGNGSGNGVIGGGGGSGSNLATPSPSPSRGVSPIPSTRIGPITGRNDAGISRYTSSPALATTRASSPALGGLFQNAWTPSWASVQEFASSLLASGEGGAYGGGAELLGGGGGGKNGGRAGRLTPGRQSSYNNSNSSSAVQKSTGTWGPEPPDRSRPRLEDVAAGTIAEREAAFRAMRTASVLESHDGVNGGLDVAGKFKRRNSDEVVRGVPSQEQEVEEHLVYLHRVQPSDTYAGIVLKYRCREDAFRKANGLWSRDNIQVRKWLALPVDACEVKGRPCQAPSLDSPQVDFLAPTPGEQEDSRQGGFGGPDIDFFSGGSANEIRTEKAKIEEEGRPGTHVKWVSIDGFNEPVEIARVPRKALGYFPPRRKKSLHTISSLSTPRGSLDVPSITFSSEAAVDSPRSASSRRQSLLGGAVQRAPLSTSTPAYGASAAGGSARSRGGSAGDDGRPAWMRRSGGVGSLNRNVRAPGPETDYFNSWTKKHLPGLNMDSLPSMSVMGAETARFGFGSGAGSTASPSGGIEEESARIVESPFEEGRDVTSASQQGSGLDKAAAAVETWLRGAFARRGSGTPSLGPRGRPLHQLHHFQQQHQQQRTLPEEGDLIELTDAGGSDDGLRDGGWGANGTGGGGGGAESNAQSGLLSQIPYGSSSMSRSRSRGDGDGTVRGRVVAGGGGAKGGKSD